MSNNQCWSMPHIQDSTLYLHLRNVTYCDAMELKQNLQKKIHLKNQSNHHTMPYCRRKELSQIGLPCSIQYSLSVLISFKTSTTVQ
mmetsp:Transcript_2652/g.4915  ORF Transcript_2652/g.4915 Transcript_2652/m.4915 type:complete len:86 (+) Transcript_2652:1359-1616(+)